MFILKKGHQPGVYVPLRALFLVLMALSLLHTYIFLSTIATTQKRGRTDPGLLHGPS